MFSVSALRSAVDPGLILGGTTEKVLTDREVLEIVYNSDESFSDSSSDSGSSSDNEMDDVAVADVIINDDSDDEEEILHRDFR